jgi:hypothetical protein
MTNCFSRLTLLPILLAISPACGTDDAEEDPRDEDVIVDGKSDAFGIHEGTPDAEGILELVNTAPRATLKDEVGLGAVATDGLLKHRAGADGVDDTVDDDLFDTLVELDHVPYVGSTSFAKLLAFARSNGYVPTGPTGPTASDPFDPASCDGAPMQLAEIQQRLGTLGLYQFKMRERTCKDPGTADCTPWADKPVTDLAWASAASGEAFLGKTSAGEHRVWLFATRSCQPNINSNRTWSGSSCTGLGGQLTCDAYAGCDNKPYVMPGSPTPFDEPYFRFSGVLTSRCLRVTAKTERALISSLPSSSNEHRTKYQETVVLVRF